MSQINNDNQRMWDLIRFCRGELHSEDLITDEEFCELAKDHAAVKRLEDYDKRVTAMSTMKYEAHITIEPVFDERLTEFQNICGRYGFKAADLIMQKSRKDTPTRSSRDTFCTGWGNDSSILKTVTEGLVSDLIDRRFSVWRYKVEETLFDKRFTVKELTEA